MDKTQLNLARKWRSQQFHEVIGQELSVRILKNSLYKSHYFPVYLFSGQRGCGKTSTARIFAAAVNCAELVNFQQDPRSCVVPCLQCESCRVMQQGKHPDFIEIDAASHTGVDNIRQVIDSSSFLPLMGHKKVYLIDEAHMLSKAAFNAFLKILEEPPASVLFILATTDPEKIIDTVRSRSFQLFFKAIDRAVLVDHMTQVCDGEQILYDKEALELIAKESEGSVRDALNLLEQVRFSAKKVTQEAVRAVLGHIDEKAIVALFKEIVSGSLPAVVTWMHQSELHRFSAYFMWKKIVEFIRSSLWLHHGVIPSSFVYYHQDMKRLAKDCSVNNWMTMFDIVCDHEQIMVRSSSAHTVLEIMILKLAAVCSGSSVALKQVAPVVVEKPSEVQSEATVVSSEKPLGLQNNGAWQQFIELIKQKDEALLLSVFTQAQEPVYSEVNQRWELLFSKELYLFEEFLMSMKKLWEPVFVKLFSPQGPLVFLFTGESKSVAASFSKVARPSAPKSSLVKDTVHQGGVGYQTKQESASFEKRSMQRVQQQSSSVEQGKAVDVSDATKWNKAHMVLEKFSGTIVEVSEGYHE